MRAPLPPRAPDLEHPLAAPRQETSEPGTVRARALDRPGAPTGRLTLGQAQRLRVPALARCDLHLEQRGTRRRLHDRERVRVAVRVDADHVVQLVCKHPFHLQPSGWGRSRCRSGGEDRKRQDCDGSHPLGWTGF